MTSGTPDAPDASNWITLFILSIVWGAAFMSMALALEGYGPLTVAAGRTGIGALALLILGSALGQGLGRVPGRQGWAMVSLIGLLNVALPFALLTWGLQYVPSAFAGVSMGASPLFVLPLAILFSPGESADLRRVIGIVVGFVGVIVLVVPGGELASGGENEMPGRLACVTATLCYAVGAILTRRAPPMPPLTLTGGMLLVATAVLAPFALIFDGLPEVSVSRATLALIFVGLCPTGIAFFLRVRIIQSAGMIFMSLVAYMVPVWAVIFGVFLMGEELQPSLYIAVLLIVAGVAAAQWSSLSRLFRR
ncbi:DMT family transporter [Ovoidimarina sediminis]|uniref:DMT family transporter n=1 Tax=Ovoidimarina sediminis TaxID=3079856 RepID=UPI00290A9D72|nr:DMT family transporter [Rhodophyticola sp. MJ-SS7]MDU8943855.1 DMT family transporter [Rhodophyticola sp. MJ-SS7]